MKAYADVTRKSEYCYLELYAGSGGLSCDGTDCSMEGSELQVLKSKARFVRYVLLVNSQKNAESLRQSITSHNTGGNIEIIAGNCNKPKVIRHLLDSIPRSASTFAFIDPGGYRKLNWATIEKLATLGVNWQGEKAEMLIVFPLEMALLRNLMRPECEESITRFYGNQQWEEIKRQRLAKKMEPDEIKHRLLELFKEGLKNLGYRFVEDFKPASPTFYPYYHLICANDKGSRAKILKDAWGRPRYLRCELLYGTNKKSS